MNNKSKLRDIKLKIINGEYELSFSEVMLNRHKTELEFISQNFKDDVITGSLALKLYGLLDRNISDIDIFIDDKDRYSNYFLGFSYGDSNDNRLGYKYFKHRTGIFSRKKYQIDFFINDNINYKELDFGGVKLKVHNPLDVIKQKMCFKETKHIHDINHIIKVINLVY